MCDSVRQCATVCDSMIDITPVVIGITGGRDYRPTEDELRAFISIAKSLNANTIRHVAARGVDTTASEYAKDHGFALDPVPIDINIDGPSWHYAGNNRNGRMVNKEPHPVGWVAFPGGTGTEDCIRRAIRKGIKVYYVGRI